MIRQTPRSPEVALVLIDVLNDLEFEGGDHLLGQALPAALRIARLKRELKRRGVPVIYANDCFGHWRSDLSAIVERGTRAGARGRPVTELLLPDEDDYFVLKPKTSAFFSTPLETLLAHLGARTLVLCGTSSNTCVLYTAHDASMRDYSLVVPGDCLVSETEEDQAHALRQLEHVLRADITPSTEIQWTKILGHGRTGARAPRRTVRSAQASSA